MSKYTYVKLDLPKKKKTFKYYNLEDALENAFTYIMILLGFV